MQTPNIQLRITRTYLSEMVEAKENKLKQITVLSIKNVYYRKKNIYKNQFYFLNLTWHFCTVANNSLTENIE